MRHYFKYYVLFVVSIFLATGSWAAETKKVPTNTEPPSNIRAPKPDLGDFEYKSEGTRDPFEAVMLNRMVKSKTSATSSKSKKDAEDQLGYELESLKLVGVIKSEKGIMAMMEDTQGKGVFFRKGDPLNNKIGMWVADISNSSVVFAYKLKGEIKKVVVDLPGKK